MSDIRLKLRDAVGKAFSSATGQSHKFTLTAPKVFVLDIEDAHFHFDRRVLLPDLAAPGAPALDSRRVTGLGVIYAALFHAKSHPAQGLFVSGHTDASGSATYNQKLSEDRAKNVSLLLRGERDAWRKLSAHDDAIDDVQTVLAWQSKRAGWDCDPGGIDNKPRPRTRQAIGRFQELYNVEVDKAAKSGVDSPFKSKIAVDKQVGRETWGAIYDLYMSELMDLLDLTDYSALQQMQAALKPPARMTDFVGCGEHIPFNPARRKPPAKGSDEHLEGPQKNPPDRRVELLFFDPGEELDLVCHTKPGQCQPAECPLYLKAPPRQSPIGIPKGLPLTEVNLRLTFVDPEGEVRPFPEGLEVEAKFGDPGAVSPQAEPDAEADADAESMEVDQEPNEKVGPDGVLRFVIPRKASRLFLRILAGENRYITADRKELDKQKLVNRDAALAEVGAGRVFVALPPELDTLHSYFEVPTPAPGVKFERGCFEDVDNKQTQIGSREAPLELRLEIRWQHFEFEYFDRWTSSMTRVPQPRSHDGAGQPLPPLVMEGISSLVEADAAPDSEVESAWDIASGKSTVHCLAWLQRMPAKEGAAERSLPDDKCTTRFRTTNLFVRTEGDGASPDASRSFVMLGVGDPARDTPSADRLRLYDLPEEWRSRGYPARLAGETTDQIREFEQVAAKPSTRDKPYVVSLDAIVIEGDHGKPDLPLTYNDGDIAKRFALFDSQLRVHKPDPPSGEPYFTRLGSLKPQPRGPVLSDIPPFTRLIARGAAMYDVFARRTRAVADFKGAPVGARLAERMSSAGETLEPATLYAKPYTAPRADGTRSPYHGGSGFAAFLRCCGHDKGIELFHVIQFVSVSFEYPSVITPAELARYSLLKSAVPFPTAPPDAIPRARDCLVRIGERWNGTDDNSPPAIEIGAPVTARGKYRALLLRGPRSALEPAPYPEIRIRVLQKQRAFMSGTDGYWEASNLKPESNGHFTAAHELGHVFSHPDEYLNTDDLPSLLQPNIGESARAPGTPYGLDNGAMMNNNIEIRTRYFWDLLLYAREKGYFKEATKFAIKRGSRTFTADITSPDQSRVRFPRFQKNDVAFSRLGLCDLFVYLTGHDGFTAEKLDPSAKTSPYDGFVVVRVKMAWDITTTNRYDDLVSFMNRAWATIGERFNNPMRVALRARVDGRSVRLRLLFAPRFTCSTFPQGGDSASYLGKINPALAKPFTAADYQTRVTDDITTHGVHVNVRLAAGTPGVVGPGKPRRAVVRNDGSFLLVFTDSRFDDDTAAMFGQMVGSASGGAPRTAADLKPLADALVATFPEISSAVPEPVVA